MAVGFAGKAVTGTDSMRYASYDAVGDVVTRIDGRGVITTYSYGDPENKLTGVTYNVSGTSVPSQPNISLAYDGFGRLAILDNGITRTLRGYTSGGAVYAGYDDDDRLLNVQTGCLTTIIIEVQRQLRWRRSTDKYC
jgi:YD repeat-containing protein